MAANGGKVRVRLELDKSDFDKDFDLAIAKINQNNNKLITSNRNLVQSNKTVGKSFIDLEDSIKRTDKTLRAWGTGPNPFAQLIQQIEVFEEKAKGITSVTHYFRQMDSAINASLTHTRSNFLALSKATDVLDKDMIQLRTTFNRPINLSGVANLDDQVRYIQRNITQIKKAAVDYELSMKRIAEARAFAGSYRGNIGLTPTELTDLKNSQLAIRSFFQDVDGMASNSKVAFSQYRSSIEGASKGNIQFGSSIDNVSNKATKGVAAFRLLHRASFLLQIVGGTLVGLFGFNLFNAFLETAMGSMTARQEMLGLFREMNWGAGQINLVTDALDKMNKKWPRVNKYQVGAILANAAAMGNLTAEQTASMTDATAMVYNQFLRGGRTPQDAQLAIREIIEGEFIRLSRETGVGQKDLMAAGWSGDVKDITSMMDALEKIGYAKHWDVFTGKIQTLDDVMQVLGNTVGDIMVALGDMLLPTIVSVTLGFSGMIAAISEWWSSLPDPVKIGVITAGIAFMGFALVTLSSQIFGVLKASESLKAIWAGLETVFAALSVKVLIVIAVIALLAAAVYAIGDSYGWWTSATQEADKAQQMLTDNLGKARDTFDSATARVKELEAELATLTPGTEEYTRVQKELTAAKEDAAEATSNLSRVEGEYADRQDKITKALERNVEARKKALRAIIRYQAQIGAITPEEADAKLLGVDVIDKEISKIEGETKALEEKTRVYENAMNITPNLGRFFTELDYGVTEAGEKGWMDQLWAAISISAKEWGPYGVITDAFQDVGILIVEGVKTSFQAAIDGQKEYFKGIWDRFWSELFSTPGGTEVWEGLKAAWNDLKTALGELRVALGELFVAFSEVWSALVDAWTEVKGPLQDLSNEWGEFLKSLGIGQGSSGGGGGATKEDVSAWKSFIRDIVGFLKALTLVLKGVTQAIRDFKKWVEDTTIWLRQLKDALGTNFEFKLNLPPVLQQFLDWLVQVVHWIYGWSPGIIPAIQTLEEVWNQVWPAIYSVFMSYVYPILTLIQQLWASLVKGWDWFYNNIVLPIYNALMLIYTYTLNIGAIIQNAWESWLKPIWDKIEFYGQKIVNTWRWVKGALGAASNEIYNVVYSPIKRLWNFLSSFWSFIKNPGAGGAVGTGDGGGGGGGFGAPPGAGSPSKKGGTRLTSKGAGSGFFSQIIPGVVDTTNEMMDREMATPKYGMGADGPYGSVGKIPPEVAKLFECTDPEECSAGWDMKWGKNALDKILGWKMSVFGSTFSLKEFQTSSMSLFERLASALFNGIRYSFYYGDGKSNSAVLQSGSCNCYDGAQLLVSLANAMGIGGYLQNGFWGSIPHTWAVIGNRTFDTTAFQRGYGWRGPAQGAGAGSPVTNTNNTRKLEFHFVFQGDVNDKTELKRIIKEAVKGELNDVADGLFI